MSDAARAPNIWQGFALALLAQLLVTGHRPALGAPPAGYRDDALWVRFRGGLTVMARDGRLTDLGTGSLVPSRGGPVNIDALDWSPAFPDSPALRLKALRERASLNLGRSVPDPNLQFLVKTGRAVDVMQLAESLVRTPGVDRVDLVPLPMPAPTAPNFESLQGYRGLAPAGIGASGLLGAPGGDGAGIAVLDIEYSWNFFHQDLPAITLLGPTPIDPFSDLNHGTAVLGQIASLADGMGTTGLAPAITAYVAGANTVFGYNVASAIYSALGALGAGDVILIEQQIAGPNFVNNPPGTQFGLVPVEWSRPTYDAILTALGNGVIVVEAAGNGSQDLDAPEYSAGNGGHWPFTPENDSGAIIVGAGSSSSHTRLSFSNFGATVDLQGWGHLVCTTGYGDLYSSEGVSLYYTAGFSGTSSASPIVASACALMQSLTLEATGGVFTPQIIRDALVATGTPQGGSQHIGPLPNVPAAFASLSLTEPGEFSLVSPATGQMNVSQNPGFTWTVALAAQSYRIVVDDDPLFASPAIDETSTQPGHAHTGAALPTATTFYWRVEANNLLGMTISTPEASTFTTLRDPPGAFALVGPPDGQTGVGLQPTLDWTGSMLASWYFVSLDDTSDFSSPLLDSTLTGTLLTVPTGLLSASRTYYWQVSASNAIGTTSSTPIVASFRTIGTVPGSFLMLSPPDGPNVPTTTPTLSWSAADLADSYQVQVDDDVLFGSPQVDVSGHPSTSYMVPPAVLTNGIRYYWRVFAANENGSTPSSPASRSFGVLLPNCIGDSNRDGIVNFGDILSSLATFGSTYPGSTGIGDANFDGIVNFIDILTVLGNFSFVCPV